MLTLTISTNQYSAQTNKYQISLSTVKNEYYTHWVCKVYICANYKSQYQYGTQYLSDNFNVQL